MTPEEKVEGILQWAEESGTDFDPDFVRQMKTRIDQGKDLTVGQESAIENIWVSWKVGEWLEKQGLL